MTQAEIDAAIESFQTATVYAAIRYVQALHFGFDPKPHMEALTIFNNYIFILNEGSTCDCINTFDIICEVDKISSKYMANCNDKITEEQARNLISLIVTQQLSQVEAAIGACLDKTLLSPTICQLITTAQAAADSAQADLDLLEAKDPRAVVSTDDSLAVDGTNPAQYDVTVDVTVGETSDNGQTDVGETLEVTAPSATPGEWLVQLATHTMSFQTMSAYDTGASQNATNPAGVRATPYGTMILRGEVDLTAFDFNFTSAVGPNSILSDWAPLCTLPSSFTAVDTSVISLLPSKDQYLNVVVTGNLVHTDAPWTNNEIVIPGILKITSTGSLDIKIQMPVLADIVGSASAVSGDATFISGNDYYIELTGTVYLDGLTYNH